MAAELRTRAYSKEQMVSYLERHDSTLTEAATIAGTNPRTLGRYLAKGVIPNEWLAAIYRELKDRKPAKKEPKTRYEACTSCMKKMTIKSGEGFNNFYVSEELLNKIGVTKMPIRGYHYPDASMISHGWPKLKLYPVCEVCHKKIEDAIKTEKKTLKGKVTTKKSK